MDLNNALVNFKSLSLDKRSFSYSVLQLEKSTATVSIILVNKIPVCFSIATNVRFLCDFRIKKLPFLLVLKQKGGIHDILL